MSPIFGLPFGRRRARRDEVDLHMHSTHSDGSLSPAELVQQALRLGLRAISITDHDTTAGIPEARRAAEGTGLEVFPGVELSASDGHSDVHLLIYGCEHDPEGFESELQHFRVARERRAEEMVRRLNDLGVELTMQDVRALAGHGALGRPHVAQALILKGHVETSQEAFRRYLGHNRPAYVPKEMLTIEDAARLGRRFGGVASVAHPGTLRRDDLLSSLRERGVPGLEVWHSRHDEEVRKYYLALARRFKLVPTGGSDFHGAHNPGADMGCTCVPYSVLEELRSILPAPE